MDSYVSLPSQTDISLKRTIIEPVIDSDSFDSNDYPHSEITFEPYEEQPRKKMKVTDLQSALRDAGLDAHGTKAALSARLLAHKNNLHKMPLAALTDVLIGDLDHINKQNNSRNNIL